MENKRAVGGADPTAQGTRLDSWKAIATYLGRDVATVQRWEKLETLPVRRHRHQKQATVYAYTGELDAWRERRASDAQGSAPASAQAAPRNISVAGPPPLFGRASELASLDHALCSAIAGERQFILITGDAGAGKSALIDRFLVTPAVTEVWVARGECIPHAGAGEPYRPFLIALERLATSVGRDSIASTLAAHAPGWLLQLSSLVTFQERLRLQQRVSGTSDGRMLREFMSALDQLATVCPVVLVLDDLQWADRSSLDLLWALARCPASARLLMVGIVRTGDMAGFEPPVQHTLRDLVASRRCREIPVAPLSETDVADWISAVFGVTVQRQLGRAVWERAGGHPLFVTSLLEYLQAAAVVIPDPEAGWRVAEAAPARFAFPASLRELISAQAACLSAAQRKVLAAASTAGREFTPEMVAAVLGDDAMSVASVLTELERTRRFLEPSPREAARAEPRARRSRFIHELYHEYFYELNAPGTRSVLHARLAEFLERELSKWGIAAEELASHYERAGHTEQAIRYLRVAAETAINRTAPHEAEQHLERALGLLQAQPPSALRNEEELLLQLCLGRALLYLRGFAAPEVERVFHRAADLTYTCNNESLAVPALLGLVRSAWCTDLRSAARLGARAIALARTDSDRALAFDHHAQTLFYAGRLAEAVELGERSLDLWNASPPDSAAFLQVGYEPWVAALSEQSWRLLWRGDGVHASALADAALSRAKGFGHPDTYSFACSWAALVFLSCGLPSAAGEALLRSDQLSEEFDLALASAFTRGLKGALLIRQGRCAEGLTLVASFGAWVRDSGMTVFHPLYLRLWCEGLLASGDTTQAIEVAQRGLEFTRRTSVTHMQGDFLRLAGDASFQHFRESDSPQALNEAMTAYRDALVVCLRQRAGRVALQVAESLLFVVRETGTGIDDALGGLELRWSDGSATPDEVRAIQLLDLR